MKRYLWFILAALLLAACSGAAQAGASSTVEAYLQALVSGDDARAINLSCKEWEAQAQLELDSFNAVEATLEAPGCKETGQDGQATIVTCSGKIVANYNGENQEISLSGRPFKVIQDGGEWRMCGYQ